MAGVNMDQIVYDPVDQKSMKRSEAYAEHDGLFFGSLETQQMYYTLLDKGFEVVPKDGKPSLQPRSPKEIWKKDCIIQKEGFSESVPGLQEGDYTITCELPDKNARHVQIQYVVNSGVGAMTIKSSEFSISKDSSTWAEKFSISDEQANATLTVKASVEGGSFSFIKRNVKMVCSLSYLPMSSSQKETAKARRMSKTVAKNSERVVELTKGTTGVGMTLAWDKSLRSVVIRSMEGGGPAARTKQLQIGTKIIGIQGTRLDGMNFRQVITLLRNVPRTVVLLVTDPSVGYTPEKKTGGRTRNIEEANKRSPPMPARGAPTRRPSSQPQRPVNQPPPIPDRTPPPISPRPGAHAPPPVPSPRQSISSQDSFGSAGGRQKRPPAPAGRRPPPSKPNPSPPPPPAPQRQPAAVPVSTVPPPPTPQRQPAAVPVSTAPPPPPPHSAAAAFAPPPPPFATQPASTAPPPPPAAVVTPPPPIPVQRSAPPPPPVSQRSPPPPVPAQRTPPPPAPSAAPAPAPIPTAGGSEDPQYEKYNKMKKAGLPEGAILNAMTRDGVKPPPNFFADSSLSEPAAPRAIPPSPPAHAGGGNLLSQIQQGAPLRKTEAAEQPKPAPAAGGAGFLAQIAAGNIKLNKAEPIEKPPPAPASGMNSLLGQIQAKPKLKHVDVEKVKQEKQEHRTSLPIGGALGAIAQALDARRNQIGSGSESEDEDWNDDDEWVM